MILTRAILNDVWTKLYAADVTTPEIGLFTNDIAPDPARVFADLVEPVFTGYTRVAAPLGTTFTTPGGDSGNPLPLCVFQPTANPASPVTIFGWFLCKHVAGPPIVDTLIGMERFTVPASLASTADALIFVPTLIAQTLALWGMAERV